MKFTNHFCNYFVMFGCEIPLTLVDLIFFYTQHQNFAPGLNFQIANFHLGQSWVVPVSIQLTI